MNDTPPYHGWRRAAQLLVLAVRRFMARRDSATWLDTPRTW